jgi:GGDEF domain-containing protein
MQRCLDMVQIPIMVEDGHAAMVGCSIGIAYYVGDNESCDSLLERADEAMYMAKHAGKAASSSLFGRRRVDPHSSIRQSQLDLRVMQYEKCLFMRTNSTSALCECFSG